MSRLLGGSHDRARRGRAGPGRTVREPVHRVQRRGRDRGASRRRAPGDVRGSRGTVPGRPERWRHRHPAPDGRHPHGQPESRRRDREQVPRQQPQGDPARPRRSRAHQVPAPAGSGVHRAANRTARAEHPQARERADRRLHRRRRGQRQPAVVPAPAVDDLHLHSGPAPRRPPLVHSVQEHDARHRRPEGRDAGAADGAAGRGGRVAPGVLQRVARRARGERESGRRHDRLADDDGGRR